MKIRVDLLEGSLRPARTPDPDGAGAVVIFEGVVRPTEDAEQILGLRYEAYGPMARRELERLAEEAAREHGLMGIHVEHSVGEVGVGETSFRMTVRSVHRKEALAAMDEFIDAMKREVPIWKRPFGG
jgi:molybdopterin synthase catalytic subunit